jgi:hypothetical protein
MEMIMADLSNMPQNVLGLTLGYTLLRRLLGPTADYLGERFRDAAARSVDNLNRILSAACDKLKRDLDVPGTVNARVFKHVCDEGRFVEDPVAVEYFGGVLAAARCADEKDDSLVPIVRLIEGLSSAQLRLHFICYSCLAEYPCKKEAQESRQFWRGLRLFIPEGELREVIKLGSHADVVLAPAIDGLVERGLLDAPYGIRMGPGMLLGGEVPDKNGIQLRPTPKGADLFLRALGFKTLPFDMVFSVDLKPRLSSALLSDLPFPAEYLLDHADVSEPEKRLAGLESRIDDLEFDVSDLRDEVEPK